MAYGSWVEKKTEVYNNGYYKLSATWGYRQDVIANAIQFRVTKWHIQRISSSVTGWWKSECPIGLGTITANRHTWKANVDTRGGEVTINNTNGNGNVRNCGMNADGTPTETNIHLYCKPGSISATGVPNVGWVLKKVNSYIPQIDRNAPTAYISYSSKTYNSLTFSVSASTDCDVVQYRVNSGAWQDTGFTLTSGSAKTLTVSGLSPNTSYTVETRARRTYNQVYSSNAASTQTTSKPNAPTKGSVSVTSKTYKSASFSISGFSFGSGATWGYYRYRVNSGSWVVINSSTSFTVNDLKPNTSYNIEVQLVDNYSTASSSATTSVTTNKPPVPSAGRISVGEITPFTISISYSGFGLGDMASLSKYEVACYTDSPNYVSNGTGTSYTFSNLTPATTYTISVRLTDNYGQTAVATTTATTLEDQAKVYIKVNGSWKQGKIFIKQNGSWKKVKAVYVKKGGNWVKNL